MRKICFITGTRAEYGLLSRLMHLVDDSPICELQIIATNMHLMPEYGNTYTEIEDDGFNITAKVPMPKPADNSYGVVTSMATEMSGMNDVLQKLNPDLVVILGDRYEILVAATVAMIHQIPIAHLYGGEITEGAMDDSIRHCITKLSHLHFTSTEEYRQRVIQLGENPKYVFNVGAVGVENIKTIPLMSKFEVESSLDFKIDDNTVLCTYHPVTLGDCFPSHDIQQLLSALDARPHLRVIFTMPNSDQGGDTIRHEIETYCLHNTNKAIAFVSLGMRRYLSVLQYVAAVIGNSSSGIVEVPSAHIPTLNIGDRQKGRTRGTSVYDVGTDKKSIIQGLDHILSSEFKLYCKNTTNPYEKTNTANEIFDVMSSIDLTDITKKQFYDLPQ